MKALTLLFTLGLLVTARAQEAEDASQAGQILERYLAAAHLQGPSETAPYDPAADARVNQARQARLAILSELKAMPDEAVVAAEPVLFERAASQQRLEIVGFLGDHIRTRACADLLHRVLQNVRETKDKDEALCEDLVRASAVHGLRMMARRTNRAGAKRIVQNRKVPAPVPGLVPYLLSAAKDKAERVRVNALYALADSRDPCAVAELRDRLKDESARVRLHAACFLTEYEDASGLQEMGATLHRFQKTDSAENPDFESYLQLEMLFASLERITGKIFGEIPLNPALSPRSDGLEAKQYRDLLDVWKGWWDSQSGGSG